MDSRTRRRLGLLSLLGACLAVLLGGWPAGATHAQQIPSTALVGVIDDEPSDETDEPPEDETSIGGTLRTRDDEGEDVFVEGVTMIVRIGSEGDPANAGEEVGQAVTDADGAWRVVLPTDGFVVTGSSARPSGFFDVELVEATLPEGVPLRTEGRNVLENIKVDLGEAKNTLFPLGEAVESTNTTIRWIQLFVDGLKLGLIIAMCAIGLSLIYGTTGLTNFSHGEAVTLGAMIAFVFHVVYGASGKDMEFFGLFKLWSDGRLLGIPGTNSLVFGRSSPSCSPVSPAGPTTSSCGGGCATRGPA